MVVDRSCACRERDGLLNRQALNSAVEQNYTFLKDNPPVLISSGGAVLVKEDAS